MRAGRFKKASNMNYCLEVSRQTENIMQACFLLPPWLAHR